MNKVKEEKDMDRILIFQVCTPDDSIFMCLREDYKMEIGVSKREVQQ